MVRASLLTALSGAIVFDVADAWRCMGMEDEGDIDGCCWAVDQGCYNDVCTLPEGNWLSACDQKACTVDRSNCNLECYCASKDWVEPLRMNDGGYPEIGWIGNEVILNKCEYRLDNINGRLTCTNGTVPPSDCKIATRQPKEGTIVIEPNDGTKCGEKCCGECVTWNYNCGHCSSAYNHPPGIWAPQCMTLANYSTVITTTTPPTWTQRSLVADEGNEVVSFDSVTADNCKAACDLFPSDACHSFSFNSDKARCHLKDKCVNAHDHSDHNPNHRGYSTYYKPCTSFIVV